jgi:hypothetical protein
MTFRWIGLGALMAMTPEQRQAFEVQGEYAIDLDDLSGAPRARFVRDLECDDASAKRDGEDWWGGE